MAYEHVKRDFSGIVAECYGQEMSYPVVSGFRNREESLPINEATSFGIASGTKGFTALAVLRLIDQGKLSLEDRVFVLLSQAFPNMDSGVTVKQLLCHTSGIYDYFDEEVLEDFGTMFEKVTIQKIHGPSDMYPLLIEGPAKFAPGERFCYNNGGYVILGMLVESVSGMAYDAFLRQELIEPLGLVHTGCYDARMLPANVAAGYELVEGRWLNNSFDIPMKCTADGGLYTCAADMDRVWRTVVEGDYLSTELREKVFSVQAVIKGERCYGLGFYIHLDKDGAPEYYGLVGEDPGVSFWSRYYLKEKRVVTVLSNTSFGAWEVI